MILAAALCAFAAGACDASKAPVGAADEVRVTVTPSSKDLGPLEAAPFAASVTGTQIAGVTWTTTGGSIDATGMYRAPSTAGTFQVRATSVVNGNVFGTATVNVSSAPPSAPGSCATQPLRTTGTTYYYCDCATGQLGGSPDAACVPGNDANAGTSPSAPRRSLSDAQSRFASMAAGSTVALCRGGVWNGSVDFTNTGCTQTDPCDFRDYVPSWGSASTPRPRIASGGTVLAVQGAPARGNYRIWNIDVRNPAQGGANGVVLLFDGSFHDVDFCNLRVDGGWLGVYFEPSDTTPNRISLRDSQIYNGQFSGFYGGAPGVVITGNYFEGNGVNTGSGGMLMHSAYLISEIGGGLPTDPSVPATYTFSNNQLVEGPYCDGVILVVHGVFRNNKLVIENNDISTTSTSAQCYGFQTAGGLAGAEFHDATFRRNRIRTPGQTGAEFSCCDNCTFSDNIIVNGGLQLSSSDCNAGSFRSGHQVVQNNTLYESGLFIGSVGTGPYDLDNNVVWMSAAGACFNTQQLGRNDSNYCRAGTGPAATAVFVNPSAGNFRPAPSSPLIGYGNATYYSPLAIGAPTWSPTDAGAPRTPPIDAGALIH
jgi:hypothetical protein